MRRLIKDKQKSQAVSVKSSPPALQKYGLN